MNMANDVSFLFGLGVFVFVTEKVLKESGRGDMAFLVSLGGFIFGLGIVISILSKFLGSMRMAFPISLF